MSPIVHELGLEPLDRLSGVDSLCLFVGEDERPLRGLAGYVDWRMCGALSRVLIDGFFQGREGEDLLLPSAGRFPLERIFVIGVGPTQKLRPEGLGRVLAHAARVLSLAKVEGLAAEIPGEGPIDEEIRAGAIRNQFLPALGKIRVELFGSKSLSRRLSA